MTHFSCKSNFHSNVLADNKGLRNGKSGEVKVRIATNGAS